MIQQIYPACESLTSPMKMVLRIASWINA